MEIRSLIIPFIAQADVENPLTIGALDSQPTLLEEHTPEDLQTLLNIHLPQKGVGKVGLLELVERILQYSVNTWDRGFMHKLSGATNAVGVISELVLAVLNANVSQSKTPNHQILHPSPESAH
jgi:glutamate decarboxylase